MNRTIYVCPGEGCSFLSMTPGQCRSHPYPCRAMGPELVPLEVAPLASDAKPAVTITIREEGDELAANCELRPGADEFDTDDQLPETHMLAALMMSIVDDENEGDESSTTLRHERNFWSWKHARRVAEIQELREELPPGSPNYLAPGETDDQTAATKEKLGRELGPSDAGGRTS